MVGSGRFLARRVGRAPSRYHVSVRSPCRDAGVAFFMKQMTRKAPIPADLMVREFPSVIATQEEP